MTELERAMARALQAQKAYHTACCEVYMTCGPELLEMLKIGKREATSRAYQESPER